MLRAQRYLSKCRQPVIIQRLVEEQLPKIPYSGILKLYDELVPKLTQPELAFFAANDRYYLTTEILGRRDAHHPWIYASCREVEARPYGYVDLWAREHFKTSLISVAGTIQEIINDPEITIGVFSATKSLAHNLVGQIMEELQANESLKTLFSDVFWEEPKTQAREWGRNVGITVRRNSNPREPTLSGWGLLDGMPVGMHFRLRVYDDVITERNVTNPEQIQKITERWELSDNLSSGEGLLEVIGTRYFQGDTYEQMIDRGVVIPRIKPATDNGRIDGKPVLLTKEQWDKKKRTQRSTLASQMLQNPMAAGQAIFDPLTLRPFKLRPRTLNVYIVCDYAGSKSKTSDRTAMAVIGVDAAENKYLLDGFCHRMSLTEKWECLSELYKKWSPDWKGPAGVKFVAVGYEKYGANSDIDYFYKEMEQKDAVKFPIEVLGYVSEMKDQSKKARVARLEPDFEGNAFYLPSKVWRPNATWWVDEAGYEHAGPMPDGKNGKVFVGPRVCTWKINISNGQIIYLPIPMADASYEEVLPSGKKVIRRKPGRYVSAGGVQHPGTRERLTPEEEQVIKLGEGHRIVRPIKRMDADDPPNAYDLTHVFVEEFKAFPMSTMKDLLDATSRIYDMKPVAPMIIDPELIRTPEYD